MFSVYTMIKVVSVWEPREWWRRCIGAIQHRSENARATFYVLLSQCKWPLFTLLCIILASSRILAIITIFFSFFFSPQSAMLLPFSGRTQHCPNIIIVCVRAYMLHLFVCSDYSDISVISYPILCRNRQ